MHALKLHGPLRVSTLVGLACVPLLGCWSTPRPSDVAIYASGTDLESGNPLVTIHSLSRQLQRYALFVTLAKYDAELRPVPYAARTWEWSADRRALTLRLVSGLRWHDGKPTIAGDVAFTIDAARDPATGFWRAADLAGVDSVRVLDDTTAIVEFRTAQPTFPAVFCELPIVPSHLLRTVAHGEMKRAAFNLAPVGNGPFRFAERRAGSSWVFRRNDDFPPTLGGPPRLAGLVITVVDEPTTKFAGLASGELDVAGIAPTMAHLVARDRSLRVLDYPVLFVTGVVFNVRKSPFDDPRVRRAVSLSIDRGRIVRAALAGFGRPADGPVPPENPFAAPAGSAHDTATADKLLDAAGWTRQGAGRRTRGGRPLEFDLLTVGSGDNALEQLVQADLAARGIRVNIRQVELGAFLTDARAADKKFDALVTGVPGDVSLAFLASMFETRQRGGALDYAGFHAPSLDTLFVRARDARDDSSRIDAWRRVQQMLTDSMPVAWIYHSRGVQGVARRLKNVSMDLRGELVTLSEWQIGDSAKRVARR
jgi:peptide/nickel transport system substrate-binding protein